MWNSARVYSLAFREQRISPYRGRNFRHETTMQCNRVRKATQFILTHTYIYLHTPDKNSLTIVIALVMRTMHLSLSLFLTHEQKHDSFSFSSSYSFAYSFLIYLYIIYHKRQKRKVRQKVAEYFLLAIDLDACYASFA